MMLCWIPEGRAYKKRMPFVGYHRELLENFLKRFWEFYDQLLTYRKPPTPETATQLEAEFDKLLAAQTGYGELDKRIATLTPRCGCSAGETQVKKASLWLVPKHPELPL